jgi:hypothetical protein
MPPLAFVPDELRHAPFKGTVARTSGLLTARQLHGPTWTRLFTDVYVHRDVLVTDEIRLEAVRLAAPLDAIVAGLTAAWLYGAWHPLPGEAVPMELARPRKTSGSGVVGLRVSRGDSPPFVEDVDVEDIRGVRVTSPLRTCWDLARARSLVESVVVLDAFAASGLVNLPKFLAYLDAYAMRKGITQMRMAVRLASAYSASPGESRMRMVVVLAGFPEPYVNIPFESKAGTWVFDLLLFDVPRPVGLEYDGAYHLESGQREHDLRRENSVLLQGDVPLLRYDGRSVLVERALMVAQIAASSGCPARYELDARDFDRGPKALRW